MNAHHDVIVIGAGPAGMASASVLGEMGLDVLLLDEQPRPGGQIYRNIENAPESTLRLMGEDYAKGGRLAARFRASGARYESGAAVWQVDPEGFVCYSRDGASKQVRANYVVVATGAMERPVPIPGWTLPGVMGAGGVNNLTKEAGLVPEGRIVLAGSGPLLLLEATQLIRKGVNIEAILETTPRIPQISTARYMPPAALRPDFLWKGLTMLRQIKGSSVPHYKGVTELAAVGGERLARVEARNGSEKLSFDADLLLLHFGVIPATHVFSQAGCRMKWNAIQRYWHPECDQWGRTNHERLFAAGDGSFVAGAIAAQCKGELTGLEIAHCLGVIPDHERDALAAPLRRSLRSDALPRPFVDAMYAPAPGTLKFADDTVLCRCENVTVGQVREVVRQGATDLNEVKILTRCGMGPCQGRMCGPALAEVVGQELSRGPDRVGRLSIRPPLKGVSLGEIAEMELMNMSSEPANLFKNQSK